MNLPLEAKRILIFFFVFIYESIQKDEEETKRVKLQLEEVQSANDSLKEAISRSNAEFLSKIEAQKKDNESQVLYLVQQLRVAEAKLRSESGAVWNNGGQMDGDDSRGPSHMSASNKKESRPKTANAAVSVAGDRPKSDSNATDKMRSGEKAIHPVGEIETNLDEINIIMKKWHAEKQRREQLEKRNVELTRELRSLKTPPIGPNQVSK